MESQFQVLFNFNYRLMISPVAMVFMHNRQLCQILTFRKTDLTAGSCSYVIKRSQENIIQTVCVLQPDLGTLRCECWGWILSGRGEAGRGTARKGGPTPDRWWHSRGFWCRWCHWAGPGTSGCWPAWNMARSCSLHGHKGKNTVLASCLVEL